ncbi:hypothetical protein ACHAPO_007402 [Fusarium lateritium]
MFGFPKQYNASLNQRLKLFDDQDDPALTVGGAIVGDIVRKVSNEQTKEDFGSFLDSKLELIWDLAFAVLKPTDTDGLECLATCLIKVTTADQHGLTGRTWEQNLKDGLTYILCRLDKANFAGNDKNKLWLIYNILH